MQALQMCPAATAITQGKQNVYLQHIDFNPLMCIVLKNLYMSCSAINVNSHSKLSCVNTEYLDRQHMAVRYTARAWLML